MLDVISGQTSLPALLPLFSLMYPLFNLYFTC